MAGRGREVAVGVLGVEAGLDRVPELGRLLPLEAAALRHVDLGLDEVDAGGGLGDRVLDLQAGVDLEEGEGPLAGVVEELDGPRADVPHGQGEPLGRVLDLLGLLRAEQRRGRLLDDLLVAALDRAVADAERPRGAVAVGDQLHLDVAGAGDQALEEDGAVAEGPERLVAGALEGVLEVGGRGDHPDAAATATGGRLEHQRVADLVGCSQGVLEGVHGAAAPRSHGYADLLGDQLRADLVAEPAHRLGARPDEGDAVLVAQVDERRVLGHEAPARPHGVGAGVEQGLLEHGQVDVRPVGGWSEVVGEVGLAHEHRVGLARGVQGDGLDVVAGSPDALSSRTAWSNRMADSPRLTIAIRRNDTNYPSGLTLQTRGWSRVTPKVSRGGGYARVT